MKRKSKDVLPENRLSPLAAPKSLNAPAERKSVSKTDKNQDVVLVHPRFNLVGLNFLSHSLDCNLWKRQDWLKKLLRLRAIAKQMASVCMSILLEMSYQTNRICWMRGKVRVSFVWKSIETVGFEGGDRKVFGRRLREDIEGLADAELRARSTKKIVPSGVGTRSVG